MLCRCILTHTSSTIRSKISCTIYKCSKVTDFLSVHEYVHVDSGRAFTLHVGVCEAMYDFCQPVDAGLKVLVGS